MPLRIYNGILCCEKDNGLIDRHVAQLSTLGQPMTHCLYYGMEGQAASQWPHYRVGLHEAYENITGKVYCAFKHALTVPDWDLFFKTDVTSRVVSVDWDLAARSDLTGWVTSIIGPLGRSQMDRHYSTKRYTERALDEVFPGEPPKQWIGGPAYVASRKLIALVVQRGIWTARSWQAEDVYIARVAADHGIIPVHGVEYEAWTAPA